MSQCHMCIGLVQMEAERDAQAGQARRVVTELQMVTAQRDRLLAIVARLCHATEWWEATADDPYPVWERMELDGWGDMACTVATEQMAAIDAGLIRWALGLDGDEQDERETI